MKETCRHIRRCYFEDCIDPGTFPRCLGNPPVPTIGSSEPSPLMVMPTDLEHELIGFTFALAITTFGTTRFADRSVINLSLPLVPTILASPPRFEL